MKKAIRSKTAQYTAGEIGRVRVSEDFLPAPEELVPRDVKIQPQRGEQSSRVRTAMTALRAAKKKPLPVLS